MPFRADEPPCGMAEETTAEELRDRVGDEELAILDVRDAHAYRQGHIPGAESLPLTDIDDSVVDREWPTEVVLVDYTGDVAPSAAEKIGERIDSRVSALADGMSSWEGELEPGF